MTTIKELADERRVKIAEVKKILRDEYRDEELDFTSPDRALTPVQVQRAHELLDLRVEQRHVRPADVVAARVAIELPAPALAHSFAAPTAVPGVPRAGGTYRLLLHGDILDFLGSPKGDVRRLQAAVKRLMREMLVEGRAQRRVKGTRGVNSGWLRAPLGDNGGFHFYLWHSLAGMRCVDELALDRGDVVLRAVRHHDETNALLDPGARADYLELDAATYVTDLETPAAVDVLSLPQRAACDHAASLSITKGHPGAGKTTLQLERTRRHEGKLLFVTFGEAQRAQAARWLQTYAHPGQEVVAWTHQDLFQSLDPAWRSAPLHGAAIAELQAAIAGEPRGVGPWAAHPGALYAELRGHYWGRALPFDFRDALAVRDDDAAARGYRERRTAVLGKPAVDGAIQAVKALPADVRERLFGDLDRVRALASQLGGDDVELPAGLRDLDALLIDEVQDLTLVELLACTLIARRAGATTRRRPAFHVAGDEGQTVRATDFDWGELKNLINDTLGRPEEFDLPGNVRSPLVITRVINNSWGLYKTMAKSTRPRGYAEAEVDETAHGSVLWVDVADGELDRLCAIVAETPGAALIYPDTQLPADIADAARRAGVVHAVAAPEAKGLDFRVAFVVDVGRRASRLYQSVGGDDPIVELENRTAVDAIRVAISRATEVLVLIERPLDRDVRTRLEALCSVQGQLLDGVVTDVPIADLSGRLDVDTADRNALVSEALVDFDRTFEDDHETGLRIAERARGWLGDSKRAGAVQGELRKQVYRALGLALLRTGLASERDQRERLTRANAELNNAKEPELARLALDARAVLCGDEIARTAVTSLVKQARGEAGSRARVAVEVLERVLINARARAATTSGKDWERVVDTLELTGDVAASHPAVAGLRAELAAVACAWALEQPVNRVVNQLAARALVMVEAPPAELRARVAERQEQWDASIALYREAGRLADALRVSRERGADVARSLELARVTADPGASVLERLARLHDDLGALSADDLTEQERLALVQLVKDRLPTRKR